MTGCTLHVRLDGPDEVLRPIRGRVLVQPSESVQCKALKITLQRIASGPSATSVEGTREATLATGQRWEQSQEYAFEFSAQSESWSHDSHGFRSIWQLEARATLESGADVVQAVALRQSLPDAESARVEVTSERPAQREWAAQRTSVGFLAGVFLLLLGFAGLTYFGFVEQSLAMRVVGGLGTLLLAISLFLMRRARTWEATIGRPQVVVTSVQERGDRVAASRMLSCTVWLVERAPIATVHGKLAVRWRQHSKSTASRSSIRTVERVICERDAQAERTAPDEWRLAIPLPTTAEVPPSFAQRERDVLAGTSLFEVGAQWQLLLDVELKDGRRISVERTLCAKPVACAERAAADMSV